MDFFSEMRWRPGIGDPSFMGWFTVFAYGAASALAVLAARRTGPAPAGARGPSPRTMWIAVAVVMGFLCFNKQLDLQSLFTDIGRAIAKDQGWYGERRGVQKLFVHGLLGGSVVFAGWIGWRLRAFWLSHKLLLGGLAFTLTFVVVRAVSFHHVDEFLMSFHGGVKMNWLFELTGNVLVALAAVLELRAIPSRR